MVKISVNLTVENLLLKLFIVYMIFDVINMVGFGIIDDDDAYGLLFALKLFLESSENVFSSIQ